MDEDSCRDILSVRDYVVIAKGWSFNGLKSQTIATITIGAISFLVTLFIARTLGPNMFAQYSTALAAGSIFGIIADGGFRSLLFREATRNSLAPDYLVTDLINCARGYLLLVGSVAVVTAVIVMQRDQVHLAIATIFCFMVLTLIQQISSVFRGQGLLRYDAIYQVTLRIISSTVIIIISYYFFSTIWMIFLSWGLSSLCFVTCHNYKLFAHLNFKGLKKIFRYSMPFMLMELMICLYLRCDLILLQYFSVSEEVIGAYAAAYKLCEAYMILVSPVGILAFRYFRGKDVFDMDRKKTMKRLLFLSFLIGFAVVILTLSVSEAGIIIFFGEKFSLAVDYLLVLAPMLFFVLPNLLLNQYLIAIEKEKLLLMVMIVGLSTNLLINILFIPQHGAFASSLGKIATEAIICGTMGMLLMQPRIVSRIFP